MAAAGNGEKSVPPMMAEEVVEKKGEGVATVSEAVENLVKAVSVAAEKLVEKAVSEEMKKAAAEAEAAKREEKERGTMITLKSKDGESVEVTVASARQSETIGNMIDAGLFIPLTEIDSKTLEKVIQYCDEHGNNKPDTDEEKEKLEDFDKAFFDELAKDRSSLFDVILADNYLKIGGLLDLICQSAADRIKRKSTDGRIGGIIPIEEIREAFTINEEEGEKRHHGLQVLLSFLI